MPFVKDFPLEKLYVISSGNIACELYLFLSISSGKIYHPWSLLPEPTGPTGVHLVPYWWRQFPSLPQMLWCSAASSSDALVQCWKGIVKQQLQEVLDLVLTDDRPHSMATGLINIYTKLK